MLFGLLKGHPPRQVVGHGTRTEVESGGHRAACLRRYRLSCTKYTAEGQKATGLRPRPFNSSRSFVVSMCVGTSLYLFNFLIFRILIVTTPPIAKSIRLTMQSRICLSVRQVRRRLIHTNPTIHIDCLTSNRSGSI